MSIYKKIPAIMAEVGHVGKNRKNQGQGYSFRGIDDLYFVMQPLLAKHGVFYAPSVVNESREERASRSGGVMIYTILRVVFTFWSDDGTSFTCTTIGEAMDSGDKSANKAMSAALKYALLQVFCIPTEEDNDTENHSPDPMPKFSGHKEEFAPENDQRQLAPKNNPFLVAASSPGDYVIKCGKKYNGQSLERIGVYDAVSYGDWLKKSAEEKRQPLVGDFLEAANAIEAFARSRTPKSK